MPPTLSTRGWRRSFQTIETDTNNISPRLGVVWALGSSRHSLIRANAGRYFDRVPLRALANALLSAGNTTDLGNLRQIGVTLAPTQTGAPAFPNILPDAVPSTTLVNLTTMDRGLQNAHSDQASVEFEQQIGTGTTLGLAYQHLRGRQLIMSINQNVPACVASGGNNGCRPNPTYANNSQYSSAGSSDYNALQVSFVQRPAPWGHYRVSYTLSKSMNNLGEAFFSSPIDPFDLSKDWGRSDDDQRHRLTCRRRPRRPRWNNRGRSRRTIPGERRCPAHSAPPHNIMTGTNTIVGTPARPVVNGEFIPRNAGRAAFRRSISAC